MRGGGLRAAGRHGGRLEEAAARYGLPPEGFLDFSANLNPLGPPPALLDRLAGSLPVVARYPDPEASAARAALAARLAVPPAALLLTNGGSEAIHLAVAASLARRAGRLVLPVPTFSEYERAALAVGAPVLRLPSRPEADFRPDVDRLASALAPGDLLFLANPNNPTGTLLEPDELDHLLRRARRAGAALAVDEAFLGFVPGGGERSLARRAAADPGLVVVGSLTKLYCLPGLRLGYAVAAPRALAALAARQPAWSVNGLAQAALLACLEEADWEARSAALVAGERPVLAAALAALPGLRPLPSRANFLLVDCRAAGRPAARLADGLGRRGILVRDCADFPGLDRYYFRVAVRTARDNTALVAALTALLGGARRRRRPPAVAQPRPAGDGPRRAGAAPVLPVS